MAGDVMPIGQSSSEGHPKLDGNRVALRSRVFPDYHRRATAEAKRRGLSISDYLMELIDRDTGQVPTAANQGVLDISA